jgi:hypothetical protein
MKIHISVDEALLAQRYLCICAGALLNVVYQRLESFKFEEALLYCLRGRLQ